MRQTAASLLASGATNPDGEVPKKRAAHITAVSGKNFYYLRSHEEGFIGSQPDEPRR
jgi:hypothetical protein